MDQMDQPDFMAFIDQKAKEYVLAPSRRWDVEVCKEEFTKRFKDQISHMNDVVANTEVKDVETDKLVVQMGTSAKGLMKKVNEEIEQVLSDPEIKGVLDYVSGVKAIGKMFAQGFEGIEKGARKKHADWQFQLELERRKLEAKQREEARKLQERMDADAEKNKVKAPQLPIPSVSKDQPVVRTETGSASIRTDWVFKITSELAVQVLLTKIPSKYWKVQYNPDYDAAPPKLPSISLDSALIRADIKAGIREIPGLEVYERPISMFRSA